MNKIFGWLKSYNNFSRGDRNAILILCILILLSVIAKVIVNNIEPKSKYNYSEYEQLLNELESQKNESRANGKLLFVFDPNTITQEMLDSLNIPEFVKRNILNYRKAGGRFSSSHDLRKIYGMNDSIYAMIENYINISERKDPKANILNEESRINEIVDSNKADFRLITQETEETPIVNYNPVVLMVELNSADSTDLIQLKGIGPVYATRILKYRDLLGGFYSASQVLEVYNFPEETFENIKNGISADTLLIKKIRLNFAEYTDLLRHPYLNKKQVEAVLNYRDKNGSFQNILQLQTSGIIDSETFSRISPYLTCR